MTIQEVETIGTRKLALEKAIADTPMPEDKPTPREQEAVRVHRGWLEQRWRTVVNAEGDLADLDPKIAAIEKWIAVLTESRVRFCDELLNIDDPGRSRRAQELKMAISNIDRGCETFGPITMLAKCVSDALYAAGYAPPPGDRTPWSAGFGSLPTAERQLEKLRERRAAAHAVIDRELATSV